MSLNTSALGASTMQISIGGAGGGNGLLGTSRQNAGLGDHSALGLGGGNNNDTVNQLAGMLTGMMMMMSMMGGGGLTGLLGGGGLGGGFGGGLLGGGSGGGLGGLGGDLGSTLGGGLGAGIGGALGGPLGATVGNSLGSSIGGSAASGAGSALDQALGINSTSQNDSSTSGTDSSSDSSDPVQQLMKMFSEIMQSLFGEGQDGTQSGSSAGKQPTEGEQSAYKKGVSDALSALMGNGLSQTLGNGGLGGGQGGSAGTGLDGSGLGGKGLQNLSGPVDFQQLGNAVGTGIGMKAGIQALNDIGTHSDSSTRSFVNKGDRAMAKEIGQFMDQYPEVFGKPQYQKGPGKEVKTDDKSWAKALSKPDDDGMTPASMEQFNKAKGMIKSAMAGDTGNGNLQARGAGGSSLGIDAMMAGDTINNMALGKLGAA
ncbi:hrp/hrc Type III secretion system-Hrp elicitor/effector region-harpin/ elicitor of hypersensitivity reaction [Erwinia sp. Ejp617]|nr:harpin HrpZ family protein [Erwinia sp. Ejp617]ADP11390.1 hrp/hrc Type III secretion system-Hrp elicitor/effector region-harpin/ elicitor of hypersensitivity reaction [Erwinia sp. Ejp617]